MSYVPEWEPILAAVKRLVSSGFSELEAKSDLCHAVADRKISVRATLARKKTIFSGGNVGPPARLEPDDIDWENSRPKSPWGIGPMPGQHYEWDWTKEAIGLIEVSPADVEVVLSTSHEPIISQLGGTATKRRAVPEAITTLGETNFEGMSQKKREARVAEAKGRKPNLDPHHIESVIFKLLDENGDVSALDPKWRTQQDIVRSATAKLKKQFGDDAPPGNSQMKFYVKEGRTKWLSSFGDGRK